MRETLGVTALPVIARPGRPRTRDGRLSTDTDNTGKVYGACCTLHQDGGHCQLGSGYLGYLPRASHPTSPHLMHTLFSSYPGPATRHAHHLQEPGGNSQRDRAALSLVNPQDWDHARVQTQRATVFQPEAGRRSSPCGAAILLLHPLSIIPIYPDRRGSLTTLVSSSHNGHATSQSRATMSPQSLFRQSVIAKLGATTQKRRAFVSHDFCDVCPPSSFLSSGLAWFDVLIFSILSSTSTASQASLCFLHDSLSMLC